MTAVSAHPMMSDIKKLSFAKVAASASKEKAPVVRVAVPATMSEDRQATTASALPPSAPKKTAEVSTQTDGDNRASSPAAALPSAGTESKVVQGLKELKLDMRTPSVTVNGSGSSTEQSSKAGNSQTPSDDVSQKADSNSELGTKPPSLDGKSITSGTTFNVLDEKESLRPDDSASVKAAAEEDDAFSIRGSVFASSRMGSDVAGRLRNIQLGDMPPRTIITHTLPEAHIQGVITPESAGSGQQQVPNGGIPLATVNGNPEAFPGYYSQNPDEKLLEAMKSPKDRLFLLRLEKEVVEFVQDSKEPFMDLPPSNSFCRLLTHKLADYYHMTHSFEAVAGAVRIYRTPFCRVPPSLGSIAAANESASSTPPPAMLPKKIMRRGVDGESAPVSAGPSKPTSEVGSELKEKSAPANQKLTREEREEAYNKARLRIFGNTSQTESSTPENEDSTGVSRASSVSAKDKSSSGKRGKTGKQRRDDSESFDSRSQYTPFWGHPQQQMWAPQSLMAVNMALNGGSVPQFPGQMQPQASYTTAMPPNFAPPSQTYAPAMPSGGYGPQYNGMPTYPAAPANAARFPVPPPAPPATQQMSSFGPPIQGTPPQTWQPLPQSQAQPHNFNGQVSQPPTRAPAVTPGAPGVPYPYGQLPVHTNPRDPKSQHPIPGSYIRFNPKTHPFVPGNGMAPMPAGAPGPVVGPGPVPVPVPGPMPFAGPPQQGPAGVPIVSAPPPPPPGPMPFNGFQGPPPMPQPPYAGSGGSYGMIRQGSSNNSMPYHVPSQGPVPAPHTVQQQPLPMPPHSSPHCAPLHLSQQHVHHHHSPRLPNKPVVAGGSVGSSGAGSGPVPGPGHPVPTFGNLPAYGNPATLPQKPSAT